MRVASVTKVCLMLMVIACGVLAHRPRRQARPHMFEVHRLYGGQAPWLVSIQNLTKGKWVHVCGGTLVDASWVLSAASCVQIANNTQWRLALGKVHLHLKERYQLYVTPTEVFIDPYPIGGKWDGALAMIRLGTRVDFEKHTHIRRLCLASVHDFGNFANTVCRFVGWGQNTSKPTRTARVLYATPTRLDECFDDMFTHVENYPTDFQLKRRMICAFPMQNARVWRGDLGGALECRRQGRYLLAGVLSKVELNHRKMPLIFERVGERAEWINVLRYGLSTTTAA